MPAKAVQVFRHLTARHPYPSQITREPHTKINVNSSFYWEKSMQACVRTVFKFRNSGCTTNVLLVKDTGGSAYTVGYARERGVEVINTAEEK